MKDFEFKGWNVRYIERGLGDPLLLVHGIYTGCNHEEYARILDELARHFRVYAIDLIGCGESDCPKITHSSELHHHLLRAFVAEVIGRKTSIVASGFSCASATRLAVYDDQLVEKFSLISPSGELAHLSPGLMDRARHFLMGRLSAIGGYYETISSRPEIYLSLREDFADAEAIDPRLIEQRYIAANPPQSMYPMLSSITGHFGIELYRWLRSVRVPVQLVWGEKMGPPPEEKFHRPASWSMGKRLDVIEGTKAFPHQERSRITTEKLLGFFA